MVVVGAQGSGAPGRVVDGGTHGTVVEVDNGVVVVVLEGSLVGGTSVLLVVVVVVEPSLDGGTSVVLVVVDVVVVEVVVVAQGSGSVGVVVEGGTHGTVVVVVVSGSVVDDEVVPVGTVVEVVEVVDVVDVELVVVVCGGVGCVGRGGRVVGGTVGSGGAVNEGWIVVLDVSGVVLLDEVLLEALDVVPIDSEVVATADDGGGGDVGGDVGGAGFAGSATGATVVATTPAGNNTLGGTGIVTVVVGELGSAWPSNGAAIVVVVLARGSGRWSTSSTPSESPPDSIATPRTATAASAAAPASTSSAFWCDHHEPGGGSYSSSASHHSPSSFTGMASAELDGPTDRADHARNSTASRGTRRAAPTTRSGSWRRPSIGSTR